MITPSPQFQDSSCLLYTSRAEKSRIKEVPRGIATLDEFGPGALRIGPAPEVLRLIDRDSRNPVSYTHLDVYKRQARTRWYGAQAYVTRLKGRREVLPFVYSWFRVAAMKSRNNGWGRLGRDFSSG